MGQVVYMLITETLSWENNDLIPVQEGRSIIDLRSLLYELLTSTLEGPAGPER